VHQSLSSSSRAKVTKFSAYVHTICDLLIIAKTYIDLANEKKQAGSPDGQKALDAVNRMLSGSGISNFSKIGEGIFFNSETKMTGVPFGPTDIISGDQIWIDNPYMHKMAPIERRGKKVDPTDGERGSNVFYLGDGIIVAIYKRIAAPLSDYRKSMLNWNTVVDWEKQHPNERRRVIADFGVRRVRRLVAPEVFFEKVTERQ